MAWLTRGTNRYYYRRKKMAGKVRSEYIGAGDFGEIMAQMDAQARQERQDKRQKHQGIVEKERATDAQIAALVQAADEHVTALLLLAGYHLHKRQWRRKRDSESGSVEG